MLVSWCAGVERAVTTYNDLYKNNLANIKHIHKSPEYIKEENLDKCLLALQDPALTDQQKENIQQFYDIYKGYYDMMMLEREMIQEFSDEFAKGLQVIGSWEGLLPTEQDVHCAALTDIAKQIYPNGIETMNPQQSTSYRTGGVPKAAASGIAHEKKFGLDLKLLDIEQEPVVLMYNRYKTELLATFKSKEEAIEKTGISDLAIWRCYMGLTNSVKLNDKQRVTFEKRYKEEQYPSIFVQYIRELQHKLLWEETRFSISNFKDELSKPPYGYYDCNLYTYLLGYAMSDLITSKHRIQIGVVAEPLTEQKLSFIISCPFDTLVSKTGKDKNFILKQSDKQNKTIDMLRRMFDIKDADKSFLTTCTEIRMWLEQNVKFGCLDFACHELYVVLMMDEIEQSVDGKDYDDILYPLFKSNYKQIKAATRNIDDITERELVAEFGQEVADKYRAYVARTYPLNVGYGGNHARAWVWSKDMLRREVEYIATHHQCADCGKVISASNTTDVNGVSLIFHEKDIIGINRKLLGEDTTKFYCIPCLCEVMECDAQAIMDKIEQFKEEGCTLFQ